jgi:hypothetical protein
MTWIETAGVALAGLNALLALVLAGVYWRNHREIRSPFTLGLLLFAAFLVVHNAFLLYQWLTTMMLSGFDPTMLLVDELLQTAAVGTLVAATLR